MAQECAVELRRVTKRFADVAAVRHVSLQVPDGEFFSLLGPSGCGKTTTLRLIGGFEMPTEGEICIGGEPQGYKPPYQRPVNTVFQNYALFPHMNVYENVAFGLEMQKVPGDEARRRVAEALEMVRLSGLDKRRPNQLSGGQQQRVALARALVNHPKVLLLDEPLGALDLKLRKAMQLELKALQERVGITFVYVTHDQEEALTMSDRIGVMCQGELLQVGTALEVYESPQSRFVADFIGDSNYLVGDVLLVDQGVAEVALAPGVRVRAPAAPDVRQGKRASVTFRPEKIHINVAPDPASNQLTCVVTDVVYTGSNTTYVVAFRDAPRIMVRQLNEEASAGPAASPGDQVMISWPIGVSKAFLEEGGGDRAR
jgi:spermidine/putrescine transport system ATP-binding protein